jgi:hypothetical protein
MHVQKQASDQALTMLMIPKTIPPVDHMVKNVPEKLSPTWYLTAAPMRFSQTCALARKEDAYM